MTRTPLIAANWKMNLTHTEAAGLAKDLMTALADEHHCEVLLCPPHTALAAVAAVLLPGPDRTAAAIRLGAQNVHWERAGAFTGEVSVPMLRALGCSYVIVGHSERRHLFGEDDATAARKVLSVFADGLVPILCVGETEPQRRAGQTEDVIGGQLDVVLAALDDIDDDLAAKLVIAYEPVWAIGSGQAALPGDAAAAARFIRARVTGRLGSRVAQAVRILYGGSVNADNVGSFLTRDDVDGALVGGASLRADSFTGLVTAARGVKSP